MVDGSAHVQAFVDFVNRSPSPFHAVEQGIQALKAAGFSKISERGLFNLHPNGKYYLTRNRSTLIAFTVGGLYAQGNGFAIIGAHTDSPCPKLKPVSKLTRNGYLCAGVQLYGGGLWHTWFDRDLTVAGRVLVGAGDAMSHRLVHIKRNLMHIPSLAIHLDRGANEAFKFNSETNMAPILAQAVKDQAAGEEGRVSADAPVAKPRHHTVLLDLLAKDLRVAAKDIVDFELCVADTAPAAVGGANDEFLFSARLDNLFSSYCALQALIAAASDTDDLANGTTVQMVCLFDNEEIGSQSAYGAGSSFLHHILSRIVKSSYPEMVDIALAKSVLISADMAHGVHPNYADKHEENHRPLLNGGPVIKTNANQRYATTAITATLLRSLAAKHGIPMQDFVVRNDSPCGSTIGPILAASTGIRTVDVGCAQLAMHSIREMGGVEDLAHCVDLFTVFFKEYGKIEAGYDIDCTADPTA